MAALFNERVWDRVEVLASRFERAIVARIERRLQVMGTDVSPAMVDEALRDWLGAAAEGLLHDRVGRRIGTW